MRLHSRLKMLERPLREAADRKLVRFLFSDYAGELDLANSKCQRRVYVEGTLIEHVDIHGNMRKLPPEELEAFIESFPVEDWTNGKVGGQTP